MSDPFYAVICYLLGILMGWVVFSCAPSLPVATRSTVTVIEVDGDRVLVTFPVVNKNYSDQAANWFYIPGHGYRQGDQYPDPDKDPSLPSKSQSSQVENASIP